MSVLLYIPEKIKVGYQNRPGTYTGKLAYVIYYDNKGKLRKEKSWQSWRDDKLETHEHDNVPQDGFCLNKDVRRFNWSHFGSDRSYIRVYDPRGIEMEITPENLTGILTETDCLKRGLQGQFVYAWKGDRLVLLPCNSEEYEKAKKNTERQNINFSAKNLKPGCSYTTKSGEEAIYIGRFLWVSTKNYPHFKYVSKKAHIFAHPEKPKYGGQFFAKSDAKFLAVENSPDAVANYANLMDAWNSCPNSSQIQSWEFNPATLAIGDTDFVKHVDGELWFYRIHRNQKVYADPSKGYTYTIRNEYRFDMKTMTSRSWYYGGNNYRGGHYLKNDPNYFHEPEVQYTDTSWTTKITDVVEAVAVKTNGTKITIKTLNSISQ